MKHLPRGTIVGTKREDAVCEAVRLTYRGYGVSLAYIGEEAKGLREYVETKKELRRLIDMLGIAGRSATLLLELSRIGMGVDDELAFRQLVDLIREAALYGITIMINAEGAELADSLLDAYKRAARLYPSVGITLRADFRRSEADLAEIIPFSGRIRLVEGDRKDSAAYHRLARKAIASGRLVSLVAHNEAVYRDDRILGLQSALNAEIELPREMCPDLLDEAKNAGYRLRIQVAYGLPGLNR
ncbi:proline dehydrogenase family protein [Cohnella phaseoli]|uniref:L-proline dehydrogenase n=1 Tax=Cohnella phaseoli TaxID=456490 RepID=A0A3D9IMQ4_9BACL|nr:proline dehydrogenase family protein [Cohnella phaseoli]RED62991.1 L-proline dehydrogenase [Cohnella phaseoli]